MKRWLAQGLNRAFVIYLAALFLLCAGAGLPQGTAAQISAPSREPMLRIEIGMHTAPILQIGVDAANRYLVTASLDKTARVWELASGKLLRVLRPPIGDGNEGKLGPIAISPDGRTVVVSGWTGYEWDRQGCIYIFDRESGRLTRRITGLLNLVSRLTYSHDGSRLATAFAVPSSIRVYETSSYSQIFTDSNYGHLCTDADFDSTGRLVTSCWDGFLRLYEQTADNRTLRLVTNQKVEGGYQPSSARFSPDGSRIAVGFDDTNKVVVVSGRDLSPLFAPDNTGVNSGLIWPGAVDANANTALAQRASNLRNVSWSIDGRTLFAGGNYNRGGQFQIRYWSDSGRGKWSELAAAGDSISQILPMRDGGIVFSSAEPAFGRADASGKRTLFVTAAIADYRAMFLLLSPDGKRFQFGYEQLGKSPARFSLSERQLTTGFTFNPQDDLRPPIIFGIPVTDWNNTFAPKLNGQPLPLEPYEVSRSFAIAPNQTHFLLGTDLWLRLFDRNGLPLWQVPIPGIAWSVNISGDGQFAVAAFGNGTIRWYRMTDGKELLAFFPYSDRKRWVVWTPTGYYDCSPGAEDIIGWHVNNGRDQGADFFPVAQFRNTYYRPDVIARVLETGDAERAFQLANQEAGRQQQRADIAKQLPPIVEIISPSDDSEVRSSEIKLRYRIRTPSGEPVTGVRALVDGRPTGARLLTQESANNDVREMQVSLPERDSIISIIAENRFAPSAPATVRLRWRGRDLRAVNDSTQNNTAFKPKLYLLAVGVSKYANEKYSLKFADKDARDFVNVMLRQKGLLYRDVVIYRDKALTNEEATKEEILDGLDWIRKQTSNNDIAMVFFAGHGVNDQNNFYFFCPHQIVPERLFSTGVAFSDIKNAVSAIAGKAVFFIDTCHSGNSVGMAGQRGVLDINIVINELSSVQNGVVVFSASTSSELSYERAEWNNGAFTKALVEGLNGAAEISGTGRITYKMLDVYISERVKELTRGQQHPTMISPRETVPDFTIAVKQ